MLKNIIKIIAIILLAFIQIALFSKLTWLGAFPNIIFILAIALILKGYFQTSFLIAAIGGLILDFASPLRFGYYTFLLIGVLLIIRFVVLKSLPTPSLFLSFFIFTGAFLITDLGLSLFTFSWPGWSLAFDAVINGFWGVFCYYIVGKMMPLENEIKVV